MNDLMITCFYTAGKSGGQKTGTSRVDTAYLIHCAFSYEPSVSASAAAPASRSLCFMSHLHLNLVRSWSQELRWKSWAPDRKKGSMK